MPKSKRLTPQQRRQIIAARRERRSSPDIHLSEKNVRRSIRTK